MDQQAIVAEFEARAKRLGKPMSDVCREASVHPTTFSRWKMSEKNPDPIGAGLKSIAAIDEVLTRAELATPAPESEAA